MNRERSDPRGPMEFVKTLRIEAPDGTILFGGPTPGGRTKPVPPMPQPTAEQRQRADLKLRQLQKKHGIKP